MLAVGVRRREDPGNQGTQSWSTEMREPWEGQAGGGTT